MSTKPHIVFVPGFWEGPTVFDSVASTLQSEHGFRTTVVSLPSTGHTSPDNPTLDDDIHAVHAVISPLVAAGDHVLCVLHSAGGYIGTSALKGLTASERADAGGEGGVIGLVFLCAGVFPVEAETGPLPFFDYVGGQLLPKDPAWLLFHDLPASAAATWQARLRCQPASGWDGKITHAGYAGLPSLYLLCEADRAVTLPIQRQFAALAGSKTVSCSAGHMVMLSQPHVVIDIVRRAAGEDEGDAR